MKARTAVVSEVRQGTGTKMTATGEGTVPFFLKRCLHKHPHITTSFSYTFSKLLYLYLTASCSHKRSASRGRACGDLRFAEEIRQ